MWLGAKCNGVRSYYTILDVRAIGAGVYELDLLSGEKRIGMQRFSVQH